MKRSLLYTSSVLAHSSDALVTSSDAKGSTRTQELLSAQPASRPALAKLES